MIPVDNWKKRRLRLDICLVFLMGNVGWIQYKAVDNALNQQISLAAIAAIVSLIGMYVFGAVKDDANKMKADGQ